METLERVFKYNYNIMKWRNEYENINIQRKENWKKV